MRTGIVIICILAGLVGLAAIIGLLLHNTCDHRDPPIKVVYRKRCPEHSNADNEQQNIRYVTRQEYPAGGRYVEKAKPEPKQYSTVEMRPIRGTSIDEGVKQPENYQVVQREFVQPQDQNTTTTTYYTTGQPQPQPQENTTYQTVTYTTQPAEQQVVEVPANYNVYTQGQPQETTTYKTVTYTTENGDPVPAQAYPAGGQQVVYETGVQPDSGYTTTQVVTYETVEQPQEVVYETIQQPQEVVTREVVYEQPAATSTQVVTTTTTVTHEIGDDGVPVPVTKVEKETRRGSASGQIDY